MRVNRVLSAGFEGRWVWKVLLHVKHARDEGKGETMFRKLVKAGEIEVDGRGYTLRFYELKTMRGGRRFSCEVQLTAADRIILDDDSMSSLESKVARLAPATVYSRLLAAGPSFAA